MALYNPTSLSFITAAGRDVKIWDARLGKLIRVYRFVQRFRGLLRRCAVVLTSPCEPRNLSSTDLTTLCLDFRERKFIIGDHGTFVPGSGLAS
jgi:hypothetical protein